MANQKKQTAMRFSELDEYLLGTLSKKKGLNKTSVITLGLRELAEREGIELITPERLVAYGNKIASENDMGDIATPPLQMRNLSEWSEGLATEGIFTMVQLESFFSKEVIDELKSRKGRTITGFLQYAVREKGAEGMVF